MNLLLAIHAEHNQRTGHDIFKQDSLSTLAMHCDVCLYMQAEKRDIDEAEKRYYAELQP